MQGRRRKQEFSDEGFTIHRGFFSRQEVAELLAEIQRAETLEPGSSRLDKGGLTFKHNLFHRSPYLQAFISQKKVVDLLKEIIGPDIWVRWDQAVAKLPRAPEFPWHQDNGYNGLKQGHFQFWVAITEITAETGLLWFQPGSHKCGVMPHQPTGSHALCIGNPEQAVSIEADPGDVVLFSSLMLHRTSPNVSSGPRWAYVVEYMSLDQFDPYIKPPYFVVARGGKPCPRFVSFYRGRLNPRNQMMYLIPRLGLKFPRARTLLSSALFEMRRITGGS